MDFFPVLRSLPEYLSPTKRTARQLHQKELQLYLKLWLDAKKDIASGSDKDFICVSLAQQQKEHGFTDEEACYMAGSLLEAGSDTTSSTLYGFIQAMLLFPEVQKKAQVELDRVVGPSRLPSFEDENSLQYIRACVKESLRWMPTAVTGAVPHAVTQDDTYLGYRIPAGAGIVNNIFAIHADPTRYPNPRRFQPERYEGDTSNAAESALSPDPAKRDHFGFGAGRRFCLGVHVAERSLFIAISRLLWAFDILPESDAAGNPIMPDQEKLTEGLAVLPEKFPVRIRPRGASRAEKIRSEFNEVEEL
jgi:cytochrome P450